MSRLILCEQRKDLRKSSHSRQRRTGCWHEKWEGTHTLSIQLGVPLLHSTHLQTTLHISCKSKVLIFAPLSLHLCNSSGRLDNTDSRSPFCCQHKASWDGSSHILTTFSFIFIWFLIIFNLVAITLPQKLFFFSFSSILQCLLPLHAQGFRPPVHGKNGFHRTFGNWW